MPGDDRDPTERIADRERNATSEPRPETSDQTLPAHEGEPVQTSETAPPDGGFASRYDDIGLLGSGGMGEVRLCHDVLIGRTVALKLMRESSTGRSTAEARFSREAKIQGQLEHPSIVPVYDLGATPRGRTYFTMKKVGGETLAEIIQGLRGGDDEVAAKHSRRRLIAAFSQVCLAVHYAHERGVLHRDLKPANVMLGDFGEVYVLDWGLAKLSGVDEPSGDRGPPSLDGLVPTDAPTLDGEILGTPGYMAPEQLDGHSAALDGRADVYALGAILFEMLTYLPLHPRSSAQRAIGSTISGADARAHERAPEREVPPELEAVCVQATADAPEARYQDAREMHDALERFLDGDRDLAMRTQMADEYAERGASKAGRAIEEGGDNRTRGEAIALVSQALALDPEHAGARATLLTLMMAPPTHMPQEARDEMLEAHRAAERSAARGGAWAFCAWLAFVPILAWMGIRDLTTLTTMFALILFGAVVSVVGSRLRDPGRWASPAALVLSTVALALLSRQFGPLVLVPGLATANAVSFSLHAHGRTRWLYVGIASMAVVVPMALEFVGVLPASYVFEGGAMVIVPQLTNLPAEATLALLTGASLAVVVIPSVLMARTREGLLQAERRLALHAWQMRQLVPRQAQTALTGPQSA